MTNTNARGVKRKASAERREEVAAAASQVFYRLGYRAASMNDIAHELGFSSAALYYYIDSKEDLLAHIAKKWGYQMLDSAKELAAYAMPPAEKVRHIIRQHVRALIENRVIFTVMIQERSELPPERLTELQEGESEYLDMFTQVLSEASATGDLVIPHPKLAALALMGMCNWILRWYKEAGPMTPDEVADSFFELVYHGMRPGGEPGGYTGI